MTHSILSKLPSVPYPPPQEGRWSPVTSTLDWCEENYVVTQWSAEIVNSITNLLFMYLGVKGIWNCWKHGHDQVFMVSFLGYLVVGTGSFLFHCTLKYPMQLVDELSMIYTTCIMMYATWSFGRPRMHRILLALGLIFLSTFITLYYHHVQDPTFHQMCYTLLTLLVLGRAIHVMKLNIRPKLRSKEREAANPFPPEGVHTIQQMQNERDLEILRTMWQMIAFGISMFIGGFVCWTLDNEYCSTFIKWRRQVGLPWGLLIEGHGWWHLMTGIGAYYYIAWGVWLRHCLNHRQDEFELVWPNIWTIPLVKKRKPTMDGHRNGSLKNGSVRKNALRKKSNKSN